tara:strand:+ start:83 stop:424 length:342 start_codon:yes stop_codon:yes gene_type:complete
MIKKLVFVILLYPLIYFPLHGQDFILQEQDKQLHFGAGMITSGLGYTWSFNKHQDKKKALITGIATSIVAGIAKETFDSIRGGDFDERDILATTLGGITVSVTIPLFKKKHKQ